jgi:signal transduction histidine kinase
MLENLIVNAIKHTPAGTRIWVGASRRNGEVILKVEDEGEGVPDELKLAIFEPFKQGVVNEGSPGTGVGLSLVAQFAKLHGGRAWVEDRTGGGASFRVALPTGMTASSEAAA